MAVLKAVKDFLVHAFKYPKPFNWGYPVFFGSCGLIFAVFLSKLMFAGAFPFSSTSLIGCAVIVLLLVMAAFLVPSVLMAEKGGLDITGRYTGIGALIAILLTVFKVPALAFALGMFIPIDLNLPLLIGGAISWYVSTRSKEKKVNDARMNKGTLIASGFIAGGALMGVVSALLKFFDVDWFLSGWYSAYGEAIAIIPFIGIIAYMVISSMKVKE